MVNCKIGDSMSNPDIKFLPQLLEKKAAEAKSRQREIVVALKKAQLSEEIWQSLFDAQKSDYSAAIFNIFRKESDWFTQLRKDNEEIIPLLESFYIESEEKARNTVRQFSSLFPNACDKAGVKLDQSSRHPNYSIGNFIKTFVDERKLEVHITPRDAKTVILPADIEPLVSHLQKEIKRLFETTRDPNQFLTGLRTAYQAVLREEKKLLGDELPLRRVANRLSKNRAYFRYDEFNVDLGNAIRSGKTKIDNSRLQINHTRNTRQGMLLYGLERSGYIGFISFKTEGIP